MSRRLIAALFLASAASLGLIVFAAVGISREDDAPATKPTVVHAPKSAFEGAQIPDGVRAPSFELSDERGRRVSFAQYRGKPVVATFLYSHCEEECPAQAQQIKGAFDELGRDLPALAISVDPAGDTPASVRKFNREQGVAGRIRWVLGSESQLTKVWKGFATTSGQDHLARIVLIDKRGFQRVGFPLSQVTPSRLAHDLRVLARE